MRPLLLLKLSLGKETPPAGKRNFCALNKQDKNSFESSENKRLFASHEAYVHGNHRNYGTVLKKSLDNLLVKAWGV